ncbi:MAG TPA: divalent-cation tolerance protein CutA [Candidatus Eisenbacteria bacterium]|nr:divalent-cation tolerance protein CutA [Candidatus Eisenbacteria bacterium]
MTDKRLVLTNCGSEEEAERIGQYLVENMLAACVNIMPRIKSIYRWENKVESAAEWLLLVKTTVKNFEQVRDAIRGLHSYEVPECISLTIDDGSITYLQWINDSVK